jgi:hypothetical protein
MTRHPVSHTLTELPRWALVALLAAAVWVAQRQMDSAERRVTSVEAPPVLSVPAAMVQGGLRPRAAADVAWVTLITHQAAQAAKKEGLEWLEAQLQLVVTLDPLFRDAHFTGALLLAGNDEHTIQAAVEALQRGEAAIQDDASMPMLRGTLLYMDGRPRAAAAAYRVALSRGGPRYLEGLAAKLEAQGADCASLMTLLERLLAKLPPDSVAGLAPRYGHIRLECTLRALENAQRDHAAAFGAPATTFAPLAARLGIPADFKDPLGGAIMVDAQGRITTQNPLPRLSLDSEDPPATQHRSP